MMKNKWQWNHPELVAGRKGMGSIVPDYLRSYYAGWIAWCDGPDVKEQMTMDQAGPALLMLMDAHNIEYPSTWVDNDGPPKDWWTSFLKEFSNLTLVRLPPSPHSRALLTARSQGKANRLCEARVSASCPEAVNAWHDCVEKEIFEPEALASYLKKEMPHKLEEMGIAGDDDAILKEATEILHDPSRIGCFDQSGTPPLTPLVPRMVDRYPLGVFARNYNIFIKAEKQQWRGRSTHAKLPFHLIAKVIAKANDLAFVPNSIITGFKTTLFRYIEDNETDSQAGDTLDDVDDENFFQVDNFENGVRIVLDRTIKKFAKDLAFDLGA